MKISSEEWKNLITDSAKVFDIRIDRKEADQFACHALELLKWNRKTNLTAITNPSEIAIKHFLDSIVSAPLISPGSSLLDIGSGGGFPGIPLKILCPSLSVTLIDGVRKKVSFLNYVIRMLKIRDIEARHIRAEFLAGERGTAFDVIVCRALTSLDKFVLMALPLLAEGGMMIALKGKVSEKETGAACSLASLSTEVKTYTLPYLDAERAIVTMKLNKHPE
ncbi:16S rRNA (guanine(527)-N(7))-methyltransferase RsmG [Desulfococcaceae bacterium HSG8]|nr:16S rRNA (guanine(527)-N(7))-methyltransferase RsmG [Desulfococcaceae bacterium HSG8]